MGICANYVGNIFGKAAYAVRFFAQVSNFCVEHNFFKAWQKVVQLSFLVLFPKEFCVRKSCFNHPLIASNYVFAAIFGN